MLTMGQLVNRLYSNVIAHYMLINRKNINFPVGFAEKLRDNVNKMSEIRLTTGESLYLRYSYDCFSSEYVDWLRKYRFDPNEVVISQEGSNLSVDIHGPWERTIYWEVPLMAVICETYYDMLECVPNRNYVDVASEKGYFVKENDLTVTEGGTRRAASSIIHETVYNELYKYGISTSNVRLAMNHDQRAVGTYAHQWVMAHSALFGVKLANTMAMRIWAQEYDIVNRTELATALTDTYTTASFLDDLTPELAAIYMNYRPDSGDPYKIGKSIVNSLNNMGYYGIRSLVFSDSLNNIEARKLDNYFSVNTKFIIGTNYTNDVGFEPLDIVIKPNMFSIPQENLYSEVAKLSDSFGKYSGTNSAIERALQAIGMRKQLV